MSDEPQLATNRKCRECSACCLTLGVPELEKEPGQDCEHRCNGWNACKVYPKPGKEDTRPSICNDYECMWLQGYFGSKDKPNKIGVIFSPSEIPDIGPVLTVHEIRLDAARSGRALAIVNRTARGMPVIVVPPHGETRRIICTNPGLARKLKAHLGRHAHGG